MVKPKYHVMENRTPHFFTSRKEAAKISANIIEIPELATHYSVEHRYPDITQVAWHTGAWSRLGHLIKEIK